jgi:hypothetical protein
MQYPVNDQIGKLMFPGVSAGTSLFVRSTGGNINITGQLHVPPLNMMINQKRDYISNTMYLTVPPVELFYFDIGNQDAVDGRPGTETPIFKGTSRSIFKEAVIAGFKSEKIYAKTIK